MTSLLEEYRRRHNINCVCPINEGVLFFEKNNKPAAILLTSSATKQLHVCPDCVCNTDGITLEILTLLRYPYCTKRSVHIHVPPDSDILEYVKLHLKDGKDYRPYISKGERDQERWLWTLFLESKPFQKARITKDWEQFLSEYKFKNPEQAWIEQILWVIDNVPDAMTTFYNNVYSLAMIHRRYILVQ